MDNSQYKVDYIGLEKDQIIEAFTYNMMDQLLDCAPSDGFFHLWIKKNPAGEYESKLDLASEGLHFSVESHAQNPLMSLDKVWASAKGEILNWSQQKFNFA